jgi:hypothetical protein
MTEMIDGQRVYYLRLPNWPPGKYHLVLWPPPPGRRPDLYLGTIERKGRRFNGKRTRREAAADILSERNHA